jgi:anhydro-N-acetylmuramic acid kinase
MRALKAIGLMSGTSMDGIDVALIETDGESVVRLGPTALRGYTEGERALLRAALRDAATMKDRAARPGSLRDAEHLVTQAHGEAVERFMHEHRLQPNEVDVVGFHGQTVLHRPRDRLTLQLGDGQVLADRLGMKVVHDFRAADVAAGGEGAPLVPVFHRAIASRSGLPEPLAVVNIGGVANVTYLHGAADPVAFDTGPGNAPIDEIVRLRLGQPCDRDGRLAGLGNVDDESVASELAHSYFRRPPPKSLDRETFAHLRLDHLSNEDAVATATAFVAASIALAREHLPRPPATWIVAGGGAHNPALMSMLRDRLSGAGVLRAADVGWVGDALEAQAFAYLAVRSLRDLPLTFPTTTGVAKPLTGGALAEPRPLGAKKRK